MDKSWIQFPHTSSTYLDGLNVFLDFATTYTTDSRGKIICPCPKCKSKKWHPPDIVKQHLIVKPFPRDYTLWSLHGEEQPNMVFDRSTLSLQPVVLKQSWQAAVREQSSKAPVLEQRDEVHNQRDEVHKQRDEVHMERDEVHKERHEVHKQRDDAHKQRDDSHKQRDDVHKPRVDEVHYLTEISFPFKRKRVEDLKQRDEVHEQRDDAHKQRDEAHQQRDEGHKQRDDAHKQRDDAHKQRDEAHKQRDDVHKQRDDGHKQRDEGHKQRDEAHKQRDDAHKQRDEVLKTCNLTESLNDALRFKDAANSSILNNLSNQRKQVQKSLPNLQEKTPEDALRNQISSFLYENRHEKAFTTALSQSHDKSTKIISWLCSKVDLLGILSMCPLPLSQIVMLSILHHLNLEIEAGPLDGGISDKLNWITHLAAAIEPMDPMIAMHVKPVFEQLYNTCCTCNHGKVGPEFPSIRIRVLQHVLRSVLMMCK